MLENKRRFLGNDGEPSIWTARVGVTGDTSGLGRASAKPGSHMGAEVILLHLNAISAREYHFWSFYTSVMLTFEHHPRRIFTRQPFSRTECKGISRGSITRPG